MFWARHTKYCIMPWPGDTHHLFSVRTEPLTYKVIHTHLHACASDVKPSRFFKMVWFGKVWWNSIFPRFFPCIDVISCLKWNGRIFWETYDHIFAVFGKICQYWAVFYCFAANILFLIRKDLYFTTIDKIVWKCGVCQSMGWLVATECKANRERIRSGR